MSSSNSLNQALAFTLIPPVPEFPFLLPPPPQPHPTPLPSHRRIKLLSKRSLVTEANDLSDEEAEVDDALLAVRNRGAAFLIPLGKRHTLMEERADLQVSSDGSSTEMDAASERGGSQAEDAEGEPDLEEEQDLDASMENLDEEEEEEEVDDDDEGEEEEEEEEEDDSLASGYESPGADEVRNWPPQR
ncbi:hypothetical protein FRB99_007070 [Tulasnella sp. 403]|nr:hypothetical protein FRB99_007070 [Tulasnella sp. 403]